MARQGESWNESETYRDSWTLRECRRITRFGEINQKPTYHTNVGFTADGEFLIFATERDGRSAICKCHVPTGDITQLTEAIPGALAMGSTYQGYGGHNLCVAPKSRWAVYVQGQSVRAVQLDTLEERTLINAVEPGWALGIPSVSCDETTVIVPLATQHPETAAGQRVSRTYMEHFPTGEGMRLQLWEVPLSGGPVKTGYDEMGCRSFHCPHSPTDPDLLLFDRDFPPRYWGGSDGQTNRAWTLRLSTGQLTELPAQDANCFQVHSAWTWDGERVVYHGPSAEGGVFIGVCSAEGQPVREYTFRQANHYGHVAASPDRPAIILDGDISANLLLWLYVDSEQPRLEVIAAHHTQWGPSQATHPHPLADPTGRWLAFNSAQGGRSDVFIVRLR